MNDRLYSSFDPVLLAGENIGAGVTIGWSISTGLVVPARIGPSSDHRILAIATGAILANSFVRLDAARGHAVPLPDPATRDAAARHLVRQCQIARDLNVLPEQVRAALAELESLEGGSRV